MMPYFIICILLLFAELCYFRIAKQLGIVSVPNSRSAHDTITIIGGGIIFPIGILLQSIFFKTYDLNFLLGLSIICIISYIDDIRQIPIYTRIIIQFICSLIMLLSFVSINIILLSFILILFVGIVNAFNFMDGINGMTGIYSIIVLISLFVMNQYISFFENSYFIVSILSCIIFCLFNFRTKNKALCFAGDVGSIGIGCIVAYPLFKLMYETGDITYLVFICLYATDTGITILKRIAMHQNIFQAHNIHIYQLLVNNMGVSHQIVTIFYGIIQAIISFGLVYCKIIELEMCIQYIYMFLVIFISICLYLTLNYKINNLI